MRIGAAATAIDDDTRPGRIACLAAAFLAAACLAFLAFLGVLLAAGPAAAQFACTVTASDSTCINNGTSATAFSNDAIGTNQNATTTNNGTAPNFNAITLAGGTATAVNNGTNTGSFLAETTGTPASAAIAINNGTNHGAFQADSTNGGSATAINTGVNLGFFFVSASGNGNAVGINSGTNSGGFFVGASTGNVTATNSGTDSGDITLSTSIGNATMTNTGSVNGGIVLNTNGGSAVTFNSGFVSGTVGIFNATGPATLTNTGTILGAVQTQTTTGDATTTNSGTIANIVDTSTITGNATLTNGGTILGPVFTTTTTGTAALINTGAIIDAVVIASTNGAANVANTGTIVGQLNVHAGTMATVTNSGTISNFGGTAILFSGTADTLNLMAGSNITGAIDLIGVNDTVNFVSGNHNLTFNTLAGASVHGPDPFVVSGNRAVAIDPTPFGLADTNLMDFTRAVSGILDGIGAGAAPSGPISSAFAAADSPAGRIETLFASIPGLGYANDAAMVFKAPTFVTADGRAIWARGFGGERTQDPDPQSGMAGAHTQFFGGAVGFDMVARPDLRLGLFAGGGESRLTLDGNLGFTNSDMAFGGVYGWWNFISLGRDSFLDISLHGGGGNNSTSRTVNNNLVAGGLEFATANYTSSYISPDLKYGLNIPLWAQYTLTPSVRLRYVAGFFGGYTEAGTTAPLTVASRTIQDFEERGELKLTRATPVGPDLLLTSVHVGAIGLERVGDTTVDATLLGIGLPFVTPGKNTVGGVLGGAGFEWRTREGMSFFGAGEAIGFSDSSTVWSAKGGVRVAF